MALVATEDSNPVYSACGITFSAQTNPQYQNHNFYSEPTPAPASAVHKDLDTSWEERPCSAAFWRPAVWKQGGAVQSHKAVLEIFGVVCEEVRNGEGIARRFKHWLVLLFSCK